MRRSRATATATAASVIVLTVVAAAAAARGQMATKGDLLFADDFRSPPAYDKEYRPVGDRGWSVRAGHADWERTAGGVASVWRTGHMPVLQYRMPAIGDAVIEVEWRYTAEAGKWGGCRVSPTNPELNPRAYAASVWANQDNKARAPGMVLEHDEWKPETITTVDNRPATFEPGRWYTLRMELVGNRVLATCNGVAVYGTHEKFGLPKTSLSLGTGTAPHELRKLRVYAAKPDPNWKPPTPATATAPAPDRAAGVAATTAPSK